MAALPNESTVSCWNRRYAEPSGEHPGPAYVLSHYGYLLPVPLGEYGERKRSLDLACGRGGNALYLASIGFDSVAWDISSIVIEQLLAFAAQGKESVSAHTRDVVKEPPTPASFDVIVVSRFLDRTLIPHLINALRPNGVIFYQTFTIGVIGNSAAGGPTNPDFLLSSNELLRLFHTLTVRAFEDSGQCGLLSQGFRNESLIVAQKTD